MTWRYYNWLLWYYSVSQYDIIRKYVKKWWRLRQWYCVRIMTYCIQWTETKKHWPSNEETWYSFNNYCAIIVWPIQYCSIVVTLLVFSTRHCYWPTDRIVWLLLYSIVKLWRDDQFLTLRLLICSVDCYSRAIWPRIWLNGWWLIIGIRTVLRPADGIRDSGGNWPVLLKPIDPVSSDAIVDTVKWPYSVTSKYWPYVLFEPQLFNSAYYSMYLVAIIIVSDDDQWHYYWRRKADAGEAAGGNEGLLMYWMTSSINGMCSIKWRTYCSIR